MTFNSEGELREKGKGGGEHKAPVTTGLNSRDDGHDGGIGCGGGPSLRLPGYRNRQCHKSNSGL